jgi:hypothetical protein
VVSFMTQVVQPALHPAHLRNRVSMPQVEHVRIRVRPLPDHQLGHFGRRRNRMLDLALAIGLAPADLAIDIEDIGRVPPRFVLALDDHLEHLRNTAAPEAVALLRSTGFLLEGNVWNMDDLRRCFSSALCESFHNVSQKKP